MVPSMMRSPGNPTTASPRKSALLFRQTLQLSKSSPLCFLHNPRSFRCVIVCDFVATDERVEER